MISTSSSVSICSALIVPENCSGSVEASATLAGVATPLATIYLGTNTEINMPMAAGTFSDDGRRFVLTVSAPSVPDDVFLVDASSGALAPLVGAPAARPPAIELTASANRASSSSVVV